ncbi:hypothetical protein JTE90_009227 [Oedothorax gibbosus]|uniref:Uncharacterized protein n=1 Tax=Oedothorax gibbosus TaxID=931172 RepID=A0AAV6URM4_9ARAC|nr:hypothetical protein JTE90_009227 [Oedothorax gibbosus]
MKTISIEYNSVPVPPNCIKCQIHYDSEKRDSLLLSMVFVINEANRFRLSWHSFFLIVFHDSNIISDHLADNNSLHNISGPNSKAVAEMQLHSKFG